MPARRAPSKKPSLKACSDCGTLNPRDAQVCSNCGSSRLTEDWEGMLVIISPSNSRVGAHVGLLKPIKRAIRIAGRIVA
jgi:RNA polymerase subunit RPABC4/transcription elongation factor Spt4